MRKPTGAYVLEMGLNKIDCREAGTCSCAGEYAHSRAAQGHPPHASGGNRHETAEFGLKLEPELVTAGSGDFHAKGHCYGVFQVRPLSVET
jgi:hypothetical protein